MAAIAFEHVEKVYPNGTRALSDCNLSIGDGELMVVVGPSGCGKSTVLRLLAGLEAATRGVLRIGDRVVNDLSPQERNVAMVFQDYALYPYMTVRGNLEFPLKMRKTRRDETRRRIEWVAGLLELAPLLDRLPRQLSGGQRQRVAMGRALVREPTAFLLDEPLSNLDAKLRGQVRAEIGELQRRTGTTMMYVTHDQVEAMTLGQRVAVLDQGRVKQVASPRDLYERPANVFVAGFIGSPPMNLFPASVSLEATGAMLAVGAQHLPVAACEGLREHGGGALLAGMRPEDLRMAAPQDESGLSATIEHVEYLGHETIAEIRLDGAAAPLRLTARFRDAAHLAPGRAVRLVVDPARIHLFDREGNALR
jgi:multiple sugar transport system ATP-binding protein